MKLTLISFLSVLIVTNAQTQSIDSITLSKLRLNFTVPDMPAFKSLNTEPSNLLKPSTPMAFAVTISELYQDRKFLLPKAFALEISPSLLLNANKPPSQLKEYARRAVANSFRISIGTSADSILNSSARNLGVGFRISLINKGDLATDTNAHKKISPLLARFRKNVRQISLLKFADLKGIDRRGIDWDTLIFDHGKNEKEFEEYLANEEESSQKMFLEDFRKLKEEYKKDNWNATKLDIALSILGTSSDSLFGNLKFNRADLWITWAQKIGNKSQLLLGLNARSVNNLTDTLDSTSNSSFSNISIPARFLIGTNRVKGFAEAQYSYLGELKHHKFFFSLGAEVNIIDGVWVNLTGGFDDNTTLKKSQFITNFNLKITLPENFKLF